MARSGFQHIIERFPQARKLWEVHDKNQPNSGYRGVGTLTGYSINGLVLVLHEYPDQDGWQIYAPATDSNEIEETLVAIEQRSRREVHPSMDEIAERAP